MAILVGSLLFLATVFMWPDSVYKMRGDLLVVRKMTGGLFAVLLLITIFYIL